jgi:histidine triad (HIT) family protein
MESAQSPVWKNQDWFCHGILDGTIAVERVYENAEAVAFRAPPGHRNRKYAQHLIVIPRRHLETLLDLGGDGAAVASGLLDAVRGAAAAAGIDRTGFFVRANVMPPYQGTGHVHMHLLSGKLKKSERPAV